MNAFYKKNTFNTTSFENLTLKSNNINVYIKNARKTPKKFMLYVDTNIDTRAKVYYFLIYDFHAIMFNI